MTRDGFHGKSGWNWLVREGYRLSGCINRSVQANETIIYSFSWWVPIVSFLLSIAMLAGCVMMMLMFGDRLFWIGVALAIGAAVFLLLATPGYVLDRDTMDRETLRVRTSLFPFKTERVILDFKDVVDVVEEVETRTGRRGQQTVTKTLIFKLKDNRQQRIVKKQLLAAAEDDILRMVALATNGAPLARAVVPPSAPFVPPQPIAPPPPPPPLPTFEPPVVNRPAPITPPTNPLPAPRQPVQTVGAPKFTPPPIPENPFNRNTPGQPVTAETTIQPGMKLLGRRGATWQPVEVVELGPGPFIRVRFLENGPKLPIALTRDFLRLP